MAKLVVEDVTLDGLKPDPVAAESSGDNFENRDNDQRTFLEVDNGGASEVTVTVASEEECNFGFDHDPVVAVPAGERRLIGPFDRDRFGDPVSVTYSAVDSVTVAAYRVPS